MSCPITLPTISGKGFTSQTRFLRQHQRVLIYSGKLNATSNESGVAPKEGSLIETNGDEAPLEFSDEVLLRPPGMNEENQNRVARFQVSRFCSKTIEEGDRPLSEYMTLPVSQYSVLDAEKVERVSGDLFRVQTGALKFLRTTVTPVMMLTVKPHETGCEVTLLQCRLEGSNVAKDADEKFACQMRNYVSYQRDPETNELQITGDCTLKVAGIVPKLLLVFFPVGLVNSLGQKMLAQILRIAMPRFLEQLEKDYAAWAAGDDSRQPMGTGEFDMTDSDTEDVVEQSTT